MKVLSKEPPANILFKAAEDISMPFVHERTDEEITKAAINAINWITTVPLETLRLSACAGRLILEGTVDNQWQKDAVEAAVSHLDGMNGITNSITIRTMQCPLNSSGLLDQGNG